MNLRKFGGRDKKEQLDKNNPTLTIQNIRSLTEPLCGSSVALVNLELQVFI